MPDLILEKRGLFWPASLQYPESQFAPEGCVSGALTIDVGGKIDLKLDGVLQISNERQRVAFDTLPEDFEIAGILFGGNERVRLAGVTPSRGGSWSSNGPSHENLWLLTAVVGLSDSDVRKAPLEIKGLKFSLKDYEDWVHLRNVSQSGDDKSHTLSYSRPDDISYQLSGGKLEFIYDMELHGMGIPYQPAKIEEQAFLLYWPVASVLVDKAAELSKYFDDLFLLLTNRLSHLQWPEVIVSDDSIRATLYYYRGAQAESEEAFYAKLWTRFPKIKEQFGRIVETWLSKREQLGSAFYMYTGTRRAAFIYSEHKFMSYVLGIESLHRRTVAPSSALSERIARILSLITDNRDRKWLEGRLKHAHEPALEQRLCEAISALPLAFDNNDLRAFAKNCADARNDLSHYAGDRDSQKQRDFYEKIHTLTPALGYLYHCLILREIGFTAELLQHIFFETFESFRIQEVLKAVGIAVPKKPSPPAGP